MRKFVTRETFVKRILTREIATKTLRYTAYDLRDSPLELWESRTQYLESTEISFVFHATWSFSNPFSVQSIGILCHRYERETVAKRVTGYQADFLESRTNKVDNCSRQVNREDERPLFFLSFSLSLSELIKIN